MAHVAGVVSVEQTAGIGALCSGIGGLEMAVSAVFGLPILWQSEIDPNASQVMALRMGHPNLGDLTAVDWTEVQRPEVMCFGFPCTDISQAGKGEGIVEGNRSGLFFDCWASVRVLRPRFVVLENVPAIFVRRPGIDVVADAMARDGYDFRWLCVRASDVGACHRRKRWFCVASDSRSEYAERWGVGGVGGVVGGEDRGVGGEVWEQRSGDTFGDSRGTTENRPRSRRALTLTRQRGRGGIGDGSLFAADPSLSERRDTQPNPVDQTGRPTTEPGERAGDFDWREYEPAIRRHEWVFGRPAPHPVDAENRLSSRFVEWMMGFPDGWVSEVLPRSPALKALGNAVVQRQAEWALRTLLQIPTHTHTQRAIVASDASREGLEGHGRPVLLSDELDSAACRELSLSLSLTNPAGEHGPRSVASGDRSGRPETAFGDNGRIPVESRPPPCCRPLSHLTNEPEPPTPPATGSLPDTKPIFPPSSPLCPTPTAWLGRREAHAIGDPEQVDGP